MKLLPQRIQDFIRLRISSYATRRKLTTKIYSFFFRENSMATLLDIEDMTDKEIRNSGDA
jgi:hypothetical protein